ncbi:efflux RND transporter periplasmic adaptor subunit [Tessaracoccus caeni]|uniref:efflux RND transporter periplasmic adaptor subunit n=1 Tax=Tessaracoccus caeni TaxID=3031239 RepID=UPI0023DCDA79|nr:biotin/lipoyl-binding protein [Tessaracoccus caeni]MDF1489224.1 biotin/lipoyl-binding protein [Tessaracoccus caeni]
MSQSDDPLGRRRRRVRLVPRTRKGKTIAVALLAVVLAGAGTGTWYLLSRPTDDAPTAMTQTITVSPTTLKSTVSATGTLEPAQRADLSFDASSTVTAVEVSVGDTVEEGDVIATIDDASLQAAVTSAKADLDAAEDALDELEEDDDATDAAIAAAKAQVVVKENALTAADEALDAATMTAPFDALVAEVNVAEGDTTSGGSSGSGASQGGQGANAIGAASTSSGSSADVVLISPDRYTVSASVSSSDVARVKKGLQAELTVAGADDTVYGTVSSVAVVATSSTSGTATFPVTIDVTGSQKGLFAGSSVEAAIVVSQLTDVIAVPANAVTTDQDGTSTATKLVDGVETPTEVTLGDTVDSTVVVTDGLAEGDQIVVTMTMPRATGEDGAQQFTDGFLGGGEFPGGDFPGGGQGGGMGGGFPGGGGPNR